MISQAKDSEHYHEHLDALCRGERQGLMRIIRAGFPDDCPAYISMSVLNEEWAQKNHGQSLARLNERGGLSPCEAAAIMGKHHYVRLPEGAAVQILQGATVSESDD